MIDPWERLTSRSEADGTAMPDLIRIWLLEAVLRRLSCTNPESGLVLRGGMLTRAWVGPVRVPQDLDFAADYPWDVAGTVERFRPAMTGDFPDGVEPVPASLRGRGMWTETAFPGVRLFFRVRFSGRVQTLTADVGFGDPLVPPAEVLTYPALHPEPFPVLAARRETMIGWKLHGLAEWGDRGWRPKDLDDLLRLTEEGAETEALAEAIRVAFVSRGYPVSAARAILEHPRWTGSFDAAAKWRAHRPDLPDLAGVVGAVRGRLAGALDRLG